MSPDSNRARMPPDQVLTRKFPIVGERAPTAEALDLSRWRLTVRGHVESPLELTYEEIMGLPQSERTCDIHCVTRWSSFDRRFTGIPLGVLLERASPSPAARFVRFVAFSERSHDTSLPLEIAREDTWLVHSESGEPLTPEHGFPLRTLTPSRYFYKSLKWVQQIELLAEDRLGYWERESHYHNNGDPWAGDERFEAVPVSSEELARFRTAEAFRPYRGERNVRIGLDLRDWTPRTSDLGALYLKRCDLRGAHLAGADLRRANLSLSDLRGADLSDADLRGADLEGVTFAGADLRGADLRDTFLSATTFFDGSQRASIHRLRWDRTSGLLEDQEAYLKSAGGQDSGE